MWLAYQGIDISPTIEQLSESELPNLMAMSFVFISIAIVLVALGWTTKIIKAPKQKAGGGEDDEPVNEKLIDVIKSVMATAAILQSVHESQQSFATVVSSLIDSVNTGKEINATQHIDFLGAMQSVKNEVDRGLSKVVEATNTMTEQLTPIIENLLSELSKDRKISEDDKQDIATSVIGGLSKPIAALWETNKVEFISAVSDEIVKALSEKIETPVIKPDDSESESPIEVKEKDTTNAKPTSTNK